MSSNETPRRGGQTATGAQSRNIPCHRDGTTKRTLRQPAASFQTGNPPDTKHPLPETVAEWDRSGTDVVRVSLEEYGGTAVVNLRLWWRDGGDLRPGKKGLTLGVSHLPRLAEAVSAALRRARQLGLAP